jgi:large subunit ribosomal protein L9
MKVLLIKDVYKLGHAGDVKRVADGYGRNFLLPQGLAVIATPGALKQVEKIRKQADTRRAVLNNEMANLAELIKPIVLTFSSKAGETGKLYGSITPQMMIDAINQKLGSSLDRHIIDAEPIRTLGEHKARIRLTVDLAPEIKVIVHREGESPVLLDDTSPIQEQTSAPKQEEPVAALATEEPIAQIQEEPAEAPAPEEPAAE